MDIDKIDTVNERMLVEPVKMEETESGFASIEMGKSTPVMGKVIKGNSHYKPGDILFFRRYSVDELNFRTKDGGEQTLWVVESEDVVAVQRVV